MKKTSILFISLALVLLFASSALAAQASYFDSTAKATYFSATTVSTLSSTYSVTYNGGNLERLKSKNKFDNDGTTHYPYEIYLPNESRPDNYRIHTNYTRSTDACASCHATHTAVGPSLLQWYTVYETCIACHDGTVATTYDVVNGKIGTTPDATFGGHFGIGTEDSLSNHNVTGSVTIAAAPGGSVVGKQADRGYGVKYMAWESTFGCESCHSPHGQGGNARILNPDPNGFATLKNKHDDLTVGQEGIIGKVYLNGKSVSIITGYPYKPTIYSDGVDVTQAFIFRNDGKDSVSGAAYTYVVDRSTTDGVNLNNITSIKNAVIPYQVRMDIKNYLGLNETNETVKHVSGINDYCGACHVDYNTEPNVLAANGGNGVDKIMADKAKRPGYGVLTGEFSKAHRHAVGLKWNYAGAADTGYIGFTNKPMMTQGNGNDGNDADSDTPETTDDSYISCLTCHFAHGTSEPFWKRFINKSSFRINNEYDEWSETELHEISGSSALKRLPNMGTCEACHQKGIDAQGYNINTAQDAQDQTKGLVGEGIFTLGNYSNKIITNATCEAAACHNGMLSLFDKTAMGGIVGTDATVSCEKCHIAISGAGSTPGSSGNHAIQPSADNIINPRNLTIADQSAVCLDCHKAGNSVGAKDVTASWDASKHKASGVISCTTCHDVHKLSIEGKTLKREVNALCASCHDKTMTVGSPTFHN